MEIQTVRIEDEKGVGLLEAALEQAYQDGYDDASVGNARSEALGSVGLHRLWEELMRLIGVTV